MAVIMLIGRLVADAAVKSTSKQGVKSEFVTFTLACNDQKGDEKSSMFYDVTMNKTKLVDYLKKGVLINVVGRYKFEVTKDDSGKQFFHHNVSVFDITLCSSAKKAEGEQAASEE